MATSGCLDLEQEVAGHSKRTAGSEARSKVGGGFCRVGVQKPAERIEFDCTGLRIGGEKCECGGRQAEM